VRRAWLIARKDIREVFGRRAVVLRALIPAVVLPVVYGAMVGHEIQAAQERPDRAAAALGATLPFFAAIIVVVGALLAITITADAIAGEKERRTIESLLATPASDLEIFVGKVMAALMPALVSGYLGGGIFFLAARLASGGHALPAVPAMLAAARIILFGVPIIAVVLASLGVMVSARCSTATSAQQLSGAVFLPVSGLAIYGSLQITRWSTARLALLMAALVILCALLLRLGARALGREELIARLD
jgi:ABC-type Na+ efflux pump permease subunit